MTTSAVSCERCDGDVRFACVEVDRLRADEDERGAVRPERLQRVEQDSRALT